METRAVAIDFIKSLSISDKETIKSMLAHGIVCGADFAREHGLDPSLFSEELRHVFEGK